MEQSLKMYPLNLPEHMKAKAKRYAENLAKVKAALIPPETVRKELYPSQNKSLHLKKSYSQYRQDLHVYSNTSGGKKKNGLFVEAGAVDGLYLSNTVFFEKYLQWTGLLVEADPNDFAKLNKTRPNTWRLNGCLGSHPYEIQTIELVTNAGGGGALSYVNDKKGLHFIHDMYASKANIVKKPITCYPLNMILDAIGWTHIDYFSLDVEGAEPGILQSIDFNRYTFGTIGIECAWCHPVLLKNLKSRTDDSYNKTIMLRHFLKQHMELHGYQEVGFVEQDLFYVPKAYEATLKPNATEN